MRVVHPAAELFPMMSPATFAGHLEDIRLNGLMEPIVIDREGRLIDGRNRERACEQLGIAATTKVYAGSDVLQFVVSHNLHRRHLSDSQRAVIAAKVATRTPGMHQTKLRNITELPPSQAQAAQLLGVTESSITKAKALLSRATDELQSLVADGLSPLTTSLRVATELSLDEQMTYVANVRAGADPVKAAPPDLKQQEAKARKSPVERISQPSSFGPRRSHLELIEALTTVLEGALMAFDNAALDGTVTAEEATRLMGGLSKQIRSLNRINSLLKERSR